MNETRSYHLADMEKVLKCAQSRVGCSTLTFRDLTLGEALDKIAARGFTAVDIGVIPCYCYHIDPHTWTERDTAALLQTLALQQIRISSLNVSLGDLYSMYDEDPWTVFEQCIRIAARVGASVVTIPPGPAVKEKDWGDTAKAIAKRVRRLADIAEGLGRRLSVEAPHTNTLAHGYAQAARLFEFINDRRVGCTFDTSHAQRDGTCSIADGIDRVGAEVVHVHLRDALWKYVDLTPGKGDCDYLPFIKALIRRGYAGDFNLELEYGDASEEYVIEELDFARNYIRVLLEGKELLPEYAIWKTGRHQFLEMGARTIRGPKAFIVSRPGLKQALKPAAKLLLNSMPTRYERYEARWHRRWGIKVADRIEVDRRAARSSAGAGQKSLRVGILGCGNVGSSMHAPGFARLAGIEVVGVCDRNRDRADATASRSVCPAYYSVEDLVTQAAPNLVVNCTNEWIHYATTMYLLDSGVDVFCEKIMAEHVAKGEAMVARASEKGLVLGVNFNWRFLPGVMKIKQIKDSGALGELCILRFLCHSWGWHHVLDLVSHLGGRPTSVSALLREDPAHKDHRPWRQFADEMPYLPGVYGMAMLETEEGVAANITSSGLWDPDACLFSLDAVFRDGTVSLSGVSMQDAVGVLSSDNNLVDLSTGLTPEDGPSRFAITFQRSIEAFAEAYIKGLPVPSSGEDGLRAMRLERAVMEASVSGTKLRLTPDAVAVQ